MEKKRRRNIIIGLCVVLGAGILAVAIFLWLQQSPGRKKTLRVYFDSAALLNTGTPVTLAGRTIGSVAKIQTSVPVAERPVDHGDYEALLTLLVDDQAEIYKTMTVTMRSFWGAGSPVVIDFSRGNPISGASVEGESYCGTRASESTRLTNAPNSDSLALDPSVTEVQRLVATLRAAVQNAIDLTSKDSAFAGILQNLDGVVGNLRTLTSPTGSINRTIESVQDELGSLKKITEQVQANQNLEKTLNNLNETTSRLKRITETTDRTLVSALPKIDEALSDIKQLTGKLKEQPWRILYPTTIKYPEATPGALVPRKSRH